MPVMDGLEALPHIVRTSPSTSVVMLTGFGSDAKRRQAHELGATGYIEKGTSPGDLVDAIRGACSTPTPR
jgi:DNA-binding NarL/FixJ family response regulator